MPKAVWKGSLSLGLVNIPVSLYAATEAKDVRFHLVDRAGRRVRYRRFVERDPDAEGNLASSVRQDDFDTADDRPGGIDGGAVAPASSTGQADSGHPREFEVAFDDLVRGYEVERDRFVMVTPEEIVRARPQPSHTIDLEHFVRLEDIDPLYFEKSYYLAPPVRNRRSEAVCPAAADHAGDGSRRHRSIRASNETASGRHQGG